VTAVNGEPVESFQDLHWLALRHAIGNAQLRVDTLDDKGHLSYRTLTVSERDASFDQAPLKPPWACNVTGRPSPPFWAISPPMAWRPDPACGRVI
jgi:hypothetical protein